LVYRSRGVILTYRIKVTLSTAWVFFPINYAVDLRKLSFLIKRRTHPLSTANVMDTLFGFKHSMIFTQNLSCPRAIGTIVWRDFSDNVLMVRFFFIFSVQNLLIYLLTYLHRSDISAGNYSLSVPQLTAVRCHYPVFLFTSLPFLKRT